MCQSPQPPSPAAQLKAGSKAGFRQGATTLLPASTAHEAEGGPIPWGWGGSWVDTADSGCTPEMGTRSVSSRTFPRRAELPLL